jgi:hypothetical protein
MDEKTAEALIMTLTPLWVAVGDQVNFKTPVPGGYKTVYERLGMALEIIQGSRTNKPSPDLGFLRGTVEVVKQEAIKQARKISLGWEIRNDEEDTVRLLDADTVVEEYLDLIQQRILENGEASTEEDRLNMLVEELSTLPAILKSLAKGNEVRDRFSGNNNPYPYKL